MPAADPVNQRIRLLVMGEAQGKLKPEHKAELDAYRARGIKMAGSAPGVSSGGASTTNTDKTEYGKAIEEADIARKARRTYDTVERTANRFGTGRTKGQMFDMFTDEESGGVLDTVGGFIGNVIGRGTNLISPQDDADYATLKSLQAERVAQRQIEQKGPQTDKDAGMYRLADISPSKPLASNRRIIQDARADANEMQLKALMKQKWISKYGSLVNTAPTGIGFDQAMSIARRKLQERLGGKKPLPKAPPRRKAGREVVYDINGNPI